MSKTYCLKCEAPNMRCKCGMTKFTFRHSHKLRAPLTTKNKVEFRRFLSKCQTFPNCVPENLQPLFRNLLIKVKYYDKAINGYEWTRVTKKDKYIKDLDKIISQ